MKNKWFFLFLIVTACGKQINKLDTLIPKPVKVEKTSGDFILSKSTLISGDTVFNAVNQYFRDQTGLLTGIILPEKGPFENNIIFKKLTDTNDLGKEGYLLLIEKNKVTISANEPNGAFYGVQTLLQILSVDSTLNIPCCKITDKPRFGWRGYMLDLARMFYPIEYVKKHVDILALHKMNTLHLHLTDDEGGWRIEIKKYPLLTEKGAWRKNAKSMEPGFGPEEKPYGGFYTQDELKDLVKYAAERFVTIIPEIEMPGHSAAAIYAYPELSCKGKVYVKEKPGTFEFADPLCPGNEKTFEMMENILDEVMSVFPSQYIHIGGDECKRTAWETCPKCQKRMKTEGLKNTDELQSYFEKRIEKFVSSKGRRIIGWDEILEGGIAPEATVMSWRGEAGGVEAAKAGHDVFMAPNTYLYFDYCQTDDPKLDPTGMIGVNKIDNVYRYEPLPASLNAEEAKHILGVQACLWTTMVENPSDLEVRTLPRLCALSEIAWTPKELKDSMDFFKRLPSQYKRLMKYHFGFYIPIPSGLSEYEYFTDKATVKMFANIPGAVILYTVDNSEPNEKSMVYSGPLRISKSTIIKARTYMPDGKCSPYFTSCLQKVEKIDPVKTGNIKPGLTVTHYKDSLITIDGIKNLTADNTYVSDKIVIPAAYDTCDYFALDFSGFINIDNAGDYSFYTASDDGSALYLNDQLLVYNDGVHGKVVKEGKVPLKKGLYKLHIVYFDNHWGQSLNAEYEGPGIERKEIPANILFHQ